MKQSFYASGKLLISGEYAVLDGALALACPTRFGQSLQYTPEKGMLHWKSYDSQKKLWFEGVFDPNTFDPIHSTQVEVAIRLEQIFRAVVALEPKWTLFDGGVVECHLEFDPLWGLGTSSTLISLIAQWTGVDPYRLLAQTFGGSGYDIACAQAKGPLFYQLQQGETSVKQVHFSPSFKDRLYFVYSNQKQNSRKAMKHYKNQKFPSHFISTITEHSQNLIEAKDQDVFNSVLKAHEKLLGEILQQKPIQEEFFPDFDGQLKSLGAWGGDFFLASTGMENPNIYFQKKGYPVVIPFSDMLL